MKLHPLSGCTLQWHLPPVSLLTLYNSSHIVWFYRFSNRWIHFCKMKFKKKTGICYFYLQDSFLQQNTPLVQPKRPVFTFHWKVRNIFSPFLWMTRITYLYLNKNSQDVAFYLEDILLVPWKQKNPQRWFGILM